MRTPTQKPTTDNLGEWNVWVCHGKDKKDRIHRLNAAPKHLRDDIKKHVTTAFKLKR